MWPPEASPQGHNPRGTTPGAPPKGLASSSYKPYIVIQAVMSDIYVQNENFENVTPGASPQGHHPRGINSGCCFINLETDMVIEAAMFEISLSKMNILKMWPPGASPQGHPPGGSTPGTSLQGVASTSYDPTWQSKQPSQRSFNPKWTKSPQGHKKWPNFVKNKNFEIPTRRALSQDICSPCCTIS